MGGFPGYFSVSTDLEAELAGQTCFGFLPRCFSNSRQRAVNGQEGFLRYWTDVDSSCQLWVLCWLTRFFQIDFPPSCRPCPLTLYPSLASSHFFYFPYVLATESPVTNEFLRGPKRKACNKFHYRKRVWRTLCSRIQRGTVRWKSTDVSEEHIASIFRVEE
jgi:hypothetical protein